MGLLKAVKEGWIFLIFILINNASDIYFGLINQENQFQSIPPHFMAKGLLVRQGPINWGLVYKESY